MAVTITVTLLTLTAAGGVYALVCLAWPFTRCPRCEGTGTRRTHITSRIRPCRGCRGRGARLRYGRQLHNTLTRLHRDAARTHQPDTTWRPDWDAWTHHTHNPHTNTNTNTKEIDR